MPRKTVLEAFYILASAALCWLWLLPSARAQISSSVPQQDLSFSEQALPDVVYSVSIEGVKNVFSSGDGNDLVGNSFRFGLGIGQLKKLWFLIAQLESNIGPNETIRNGELDSEYEGTGMSLRWGFSAQSLDLRSNDGGYGFLFTFNYSDIIGRNIGGNRKLRSNISQDFYVDNYKLRITYLTVSPGIFFTWLKPKRPPGVAEKDLDTTIEGYFFTASVALPLYSRYTARYHTIDSQGVRLSEETDKGNIKGYSIVLGLSTLLGI